MLRNHLAIFASLLAALAVVPSAASAPADAESSGPADPPLPAPGSFAKKPSNAFTHHYGGVSPNNNINAFARRQATREQIIQRQQAHGRTFLDADEVVNAEVIIGKQRIQERDAPSASPQFHTETDCKQFYLEYNDSGTGADSLFAAIAYSADSGQTFLKPVMDKSAASLFSLSPSGQLVSGGSVGDLPSGTDILSFDAQASAQADGASIPTFTEAGNQLSIQDSSLAFNLCPCTTEGLTGQSNNILHLSSQGSIASNCFPVTMFTIYA